MVEILLYSYLTSIHIYICGYIFFHYTIEQRVIKKSNIFELFFFGAFLLSFIALFLNFFFSLNKLLNTVIFILPFVLFLFIFDKNFLKKAIIYSIPIALLFCLTVSYDGTYRPDAGSYHLPYISILNESKILIGINNIHYRFGHTSIMQYLSAIFNNNIFNEKGIIIPLGLIYCNFIGYCIYEIFNKRNDHLQKILVFLIISFVLFRVNRYSDFGNDAPANLIFFYLIIESIKSNDILIKVKKTIFASTYIFVNKITLLFGFFIPIYFIFKKFKIKKIVNSISIISIIFIFLYTGKNILVSGCLMFPIEQTCVNKLVWYDKNSDRGSNAINTRLENEAWTKGWMDQKGSKKDYKEFLNNFAWIDTWLNSEGKKIIKKVFPFLIFLLILYFLLFLFEKRKNIKNPKRFYISNDYYVCMIVCFLGSLLWFFKFPVFRYGYGYLICFFSLLLLINIKNFKYFQFENKLNNSFKYLILILLVGVTTKNIIRIKNGYNINATIWPNIYGNEKLFKKKENIEIKKNENIIFYKSANNECYYSLSPCTHFFNGKDFKIDEINLKIIKNYKVYFFKK